MAGPAVPISDYGHAIRTELVIPCAGNTQRSVKFPGEVVSEDL
jgi:hypothetical protein